MDKKILDHYLQFGTYTYPGLYQEKLKNDLPNDIKAVGSLVRKQIIHRTTLAAGNTGTNADMRYGDMTKVPWYRQPEDDVLVTAAAMLAELYRRDSRGFVEDRTEENKLVLTCRFVSILMASILKSKGIPVRVRSGNSPGYDIGEKEKVSADHWINQYWNKEHEKWVTIDVDSSFNEHDYDPYDLPKGVFDFPADVWLDIRSGKKNPNVFWNAKPERGAVVILWSLFYDFHSLMNNEIIYIYGPSCGYGDKKSFKKLTEKELKEVDDLAVLMKNPDENFDELKKIWETNKGFRLLSGGLL
jgi:hypothetical protein